MKETLPKQMVELKSCSFRNRPQVMQMPDQQAPVSHLDFHYVSSHLRQEKPGYYLILLRKELHHRSLRWKYEMEDER
jgi:hypothetical protein